MNLTTREVAKLLYRSMLVAGLVAVIAITSVAKAAGTMRFGVMPDGRPVYQYTLRNGQGTEAQVLSLGATLRALYLRDRDGKRVDVVLGYDTLSEYLAGRAYFGATIGRYAGRIANAELPLEGKTYHLTANNGAHAMHGGASGFNRVLWNRDGRGEGNNSVRLKYVSADGEEGFPGQLTVWVTYTLSNSNELRISYEARTSATTVVNFTNHSYFNLGGAGVGNVLAQLLSVQADRYIPTDPAGIPTGYIATVSGTDFDLRTPATLGTRLQASTTPQLVQAQGYDVTLVLGHANDRLRPIARLEDGATGLALEVMTTEPSLQLFTPHFPGGRLIGKGGRDYGGAAAVCLETQHFPDSPHQPTFPSTVLEPGKMFSSETIYRFSRLRETGD